MPGLSLVLAPPQNSPFSPPFVTGPLSRFAKGPSDSTSLSREISPRRGEGERRECALSLLSLSLCLCLSLPVSRTAHGHAHSLSLVFRLKYSWRGTACGQGAETTMWTVVCRGPAGRRWIGRCEARGRLVPSPGKVRARIEVRNQPSRLAGLRATQADDDDFSGRIKFTSTRSSDEQLKRETLEPGSGSPRRTARVAFTCDRCGKSGKATPSRRIVERRFARSAEAKLWPACVSVCSSL